MGKTVYQESGGEALIFDDSIKENDFKIRVQAFDPYIFTKRVPILFPSAKKQRVDEGYKFRINIESGELIFNMIFIAFRIYHSKWQTRY